MIDDRDDEIDQIEEDDDRDDDGTSSDSAVAAFPEKDEHGFKLFYAKVCGVRLKNPDGHRRQDVIKTLKVGDRVSIIRESETHAVVTTAAGVQFGYMPAGPEPRLMKKNGAVRRAEVHQLNRLKTATNVWIRYNSVDQSGAGAGCAAFVMVIVAVGALIWWLVS